MSCSDCVMITISSEKRRCKICSPLILMSCPFQSSVSKTSSNAAVNNFLKITPPCLTLRHNWIVFSFCTWTVIVADLYVSTLMYRQSTGHRCKDSKTDQISMESKPSPRHLPRYLTAAARQEYGVFLSVGGG